MKKRLLPYLVILIFILAVGCLYVTARVIAEGLQADTKKSTIVTCTHTGTTHLVIVRNSKAQPAHTTAKLCDKLTIENQDAQVRLMAFGVHDKHQSYDGIEERALDKNQSFTVTLNKSGNFLFHDHLDPSAQGTFTVQ